MTSDLPTREEVAPREPVILQVAAAAAHTAAVVFYEGNEQVWLADAVPANLIEPLLS